MKKITKILILASASVSAWYLSAAAAGRLAEEKAGPECTVAETTVYKECGHTETAEYPLPERCVGMTPKDASRALGGELDSFSANRLAVTRTDNSLCRHHYDVRLEGNVIKTIIRRSGNVKSVYSVSPSQFPQKDIQRLKEGIKAESDPELSEIIEAYTS